jgi:hypothetical protein
VSAERLAVVLDPHRRGFGGAQGVDAEQVGQGAVVHSDALGDLEEPDQLKAVQALGARLILVDLGAPGLDGRVAGDQPVDVANRKKPRTPCNIVLIEDGLNPLSPRSRMYSSTWAR